MKGEKAGCAVEWTIRRIIDHALNEISSPGERAKGLRRKPKHFRRGVDAGEAPFRPSLGEGFQFETAAGTEDENAGR